MQEGYAWRKEQEFNLLRWQVWHTALLPYFKKIPNYEDFAQNNKEPTKPQTWQEIKASLQGFATMMNQGRK